MNSFPHTSACLTHQRAALGFVFGICAAAVPDDTELWQRGFFMSLFICCEAHWVIITSGDLFPPLCVNVFEALKASHLCIYWISDVTWNQDGSDQSDYRYTFEYRQWKCVSASLIGSQCCIWYSRPRYITQTSRKLGGSLWASTNLVQNVLKKQERFMSTSHLSQPKLDVEFLNAPSWYHFYLGLKK